MTEMPEIPIVSYMVPQSDSATVVVCLIVAGFGVWFVFWLNTCLYQRKLIREVRRVSNGAEIEQIATPEQLHEYLNGKQVSPSGPVHKILSDLFHAGRAGMRIEVPDLIRTQLDQVSVTGHVLRNLVGVFLVMGLFGTLVGLAEGLKAAAPGLEQPGPIEMAGHLRGLLNGLYSAFAPSLWAIMSTILGAVCSALLSEYFTGTLEFEIEHAALCVWVPALVSTFPTKVLEETGEMVLSNQKLVERGTKQLHETAEAAREFKGAVDESVGMAKQWVKSSEKIQSSLNPFVQASTKLAIELNSVSESLERIGSFEQQLTKLYDQLLMEGQQLRINTETPIREFSAVLGAQTESVKATSIAVESTIALLEKQQVEMKHFVQSAQQEYSGINQRTLEELGVVGDRIVGQMLEVREQLVNERNQDRVAFDTARENLENMARAIREALEERIPLAIDHQANVTKALNSAVAEYQETVQKSSTELSNATQCLVQALNGFGHNMQSPPRKLKQSLLGRLFGKEESR